MKSSEKPLESAKPAASTPDIPSNAYEFLLDWDTQFKEAFRQELMAHKVDSCDYAEVAARCCVSLAQKRYRIDMRPLCAEEGLRSGERTKSSLEGPLPNVTLLKRFQEYIVNPIP